MVRKGGKMPRPQLLDLTLTPDTVNVGESFSVEGTLDPSNGNVTISFLAGGWGGPLDENGYFKIEGIPAESGDDLQAGEYVVSALQEIKGKPRIVADAVLTVEPRPEP